jgi:hypothetical protein
MLGYEFPTVPIRPYVKVVMPSAKGRGGKSSRGGSSKGSNGKSRRGKSQLADTGGTSISAQQAARTTPFEGNRSSCATRARSVRDYGETVNIPRKLPQRSDRSHLNPRWDSDWQWVDIMPDQVNWPTTSEEESEDLFFR